MNCKPLLLALGLTLSIAQGVEITREPYLQMTHEKGVTVVWRTNPAIQNPKVVYHKEGATDSKTCSGAAILMRSLNAEPKLSAAPEGTVQYEAVITGLEPATAYRYHVCDGDVVLTKNAKNNRFITHPPSGKPAPARIWVVGDSGTGDYHQMLVHRAMKIYTEETKRPIDLYLHVGDMAYGDGTDDQFQKKFFVPYEDTLRSTTCWASMGNHEGHTSDGEKNIGPYFDAYVCPTKGEAGGVPSEDESFYSFDYGDIHFICLNSYDIDRTPEGKMSKWLVKDLQSTKSKWIVGFWHHPPYTKGTHDSDKEKELVEMRKHIMPILENAGVDLVLSGHSHIYERSMLIDGAYETPTTSKGVVFNDGDGDPKGDGAYLKSAKTTPRNGTVAVVTGHGGALGRNAKGICPLMRSIVLDHGSTIIDIDGDTLTGVMLDLHGKERDRFSIVKRGEVKQTVIENPWTPTQDTLERTGEGVVGAPKTVTESDKAEDAGKKHEAKLAPKTSTPLIEPNAEWYYLADGDEPETEMWTKVGFDSKQEGWKAGPAGFGYGDGDDRTEIKDMRGKFTTIYIRKEFEIPKGTDLKRIGLLINYDDAFVLHVNGKEILSKQIERKENGDVSVNKHEASGAEYYPLAEFAASFREGKNVIALEGHNDDKDSSDLSLDPSLLLETD
jgi:acid phosphatase type 7